MTEAPVLDAGIEYPTSDGRPVAESPLHYACLTDVAHVLREHFKSRPGAYVGSNMLVYDDPDHARRHLSPDIFVAFGVESRQRKIYKLWEDECPAFVLEVTSGSTRLEDERKKARYSRWGVNEYFLYDPGGEYLTPALQGFEMIGGNYRAMDPRVLPNGKPGFASGALGLGLFDDVAGLRFLDPETGRVPLTPTEEAAARAEFEVRVAEAEKRASVAEKRVMAETARRRELEARLADLESRSAEGDAP